MQDQQEGRRRYRGRRPSAARVRLLELLDSGMRPLEASREVGVNERTGRDWAKGIVKSKNRRYTFDGVLVWEAPGRPKPPREEKVISARFLSVEERIEIADLYRQGHIVRRIAQRLNRAPSTISRELRRNAHPGSGDYRPWAAQRRAARAGFGRSGARARSHSTRGCGRRSRMGLAEDGARNRSAGGCGCSSRSSRRCT
jgi:IS30 family transposase